MTAQYFSTIGKKGMPNKVKQGYCSTMPGGKKHAESKISIQYYQLKPTCCVHQHTEGQKSGTNTVHLHHIYNQFQS